MFTKSLVSQALIDVTKSILEADEKKKKMLLEPELDETGFHMAAHAAKKAGQSHFEFQGKKYPVTAKPHAEGMVPPEKIGGQIYKKRDDKAAASGHSADVREEDEMKKSSNPFDVLKGKYMSQMPKKKGELTGHEHKKTSTGDVYTKKAMKEEDHPDEKEDKALVKKMVKPSALKKEEEKETHLSKHSMGEETGKYVTKPEAKKIADKEVHKHEKSMHKGHKETDLDEERHMTPSEKEKREKIVMSMKKGMAGFKDRYGDRAKNVMYATATKQAMKEEFANLQEELEYKREHGMHHHPDTIQVLHAYHKGKKIGEIHEYHDISSSGRHTGKTKWAYIHHPTMKEMIGHKTCEEAEKHLCDCHEGHCMEMEEMGMHHEEAHKMNVKKTKKEDIGGISTMSEEDDVRIDPDENMKTKTVDTLKGRQKVHADYHNQPLSYKVKLNVEEEEKTSPMEVAKELARKSFKKIRNETMMGKLGTSEEKKDD